MASTVNGLRYLVFHQDNGGTVAAGDKLVCTITNIVILDGANT